MLSALRSRLIRKSMRRPVRQLLSVLPLELRCVPTATISGTVYNDANSNGVQDGGELGIAGVTVFLSLKNTGIQAVGDPTATTDANGLYTFSGVTTNRDYVVAPVVPGGYTLTGPTRNGSSTTIPFSTNKGTTALTNVNTSKRSGEESETAVAIDPSNPNRVFVMSNEISGSGMNDSYSSDGGVTWTNSTITNNDGDPSAVFDMFGNLWITYLNTGVGTSVSLSTNGGQSFSVFATLYTSGTDQPTITTGPSNTAGHAMVAVSVNKGSVQVVHYLDVTGLGTAGTFSAEIAVPSSGSGITGEFSDIAIGAGGRTAIAYVNSGSGTGPDNVYFNYDADGIGAGAFNSRITVTATNVGSFFAPPAQNSRSVDSEPDLQWDYSGGAHNGRLYLIYSDSPGVGNADMDVYLRYSDNNGATWSNRLKINDDGATGKTQMLPKLSVDETTGNVAVSWYDCRNSAGNTATEFWGAVSYDGGVTFQPNIKLSGGQSTSLTNNQYGDYTSIDFADGRFISCWTDNSNSTGDNPNGTADHDIYIAKVVVANNLNNYFISAVNGQTYSGRDFALHSNNPTVTINQAAGQVDPTNGATINYTVVFSASVADFTTGDVTLSGTAGATTATVTGSGTTYNVAVTGMTTTGTVIATIAAGVATGNLASTSTDNTVTFDNVVPTAASSPANVTTSGASSQQVMVTFSDDLAVKIATLDGNDVRVTGPGGFDVPAAFVGVDVGSNGTPRVATYGFTPPGGLWDDADNGTYSVVLQSGQVTDTAGNAVVGNTLASFNVNIAPLTVTIDQMAGQADPTNNTTINFTVVFSAGVLDFTNSDVTLGGTAGATTAVVTGSGATYNVAVSGMTGTGTVIASLGAGVATSSGNQSKASTSTDNTVTYDGTAPTASSSPPNVNASGATSFTFTVNYSDNLAVSFATIDNNDLRVTGPGGFDVPASFVSVDTASDGTPRIGTYSITPPGGVWDSADTGSYTVVMRPGEVADTAGNTVVAGSIGTFAVNIAPLTVTIDQKAGQADPTNNSTINYTVVFSAPVTDFISSDVTLGGTAGATTAVVTGSGATYNVAVSGMTGTGTVIASLAAGVATDTGNQSQASTSTDNTVTYDVTLPTAASTPANVTTFGATSYTFTVTFSDNLAVSVASLGNGNVRVTGPGGFNVPASFVSVDVNSDGTPRVATYSITPPGGTWDIADIGTYSVVLQSGQVLDTAGNAVAGGTLGMFNVNQAPPTVANLKIDNGSAQRSMVRSLTITFSEAVTFSGALTNAITLNRNTAPNEQAGVTGLVNLAAVQGPGNTVTVTFLTSGANPVNGVANVSGLNISLPDGRYTLNIDASQVTGNVSGFNLDGDNNGFAGGNYILASAAGPASPTNIFRFFGDQNGDGAVGTNDFSPGFKQANGTTPNPSDEFFDYNDNNNIGTDDFVQFKLRFQQTFP
jgi:SdrD B-like domain